MSFLWLESYRMAPWDLGLARDELDRAWAEAVMEIKAGLEDERRLIAESARA